MMLIFKGLPALSQENPCLINEIMVANVEQLMGPTWNFDAWMELYNQTDEEYDLAGLYVSDDISNLRKWRAPDNIGTIAPRGYKLIWFDNNDILATNVSFKLEPEGGIIYISDRNGRILSRASYPESIERTSYARLSDGAEDWAFTAIPTPGSTNTASVFAYGQLAMPDISPGSCLFEKGLRITPDIPDGCEMYYTTDGSLPTKDNGKRVTTKYIIINKTSTLRFRLFKDGFLPSPVTTRSYLLKDRDYQLPIVSVVSDPRFLYDDSIGIYVRGVNGKPGIGQYVKTNWNMDWDRPVNMSYITQDGEMAENKDVDMKIVGGWSRGAKMKSFKLKGNKEYGGDRNYHYQFFKAKPFLRSRTLHMRNGGNDEKARLKDPALASIIQCSGIDLDVQSYWPVHHFINGQYMGLINMREPSNKHFVYANFGWGSDDIDAFEINCDSAYLQQCGTREGFERVYSLASKVNQAGVYDELKQWLDIDEYVNYMAMSLYLGRGDWPHNNLKGYRKHDGGRLRLVAFDIDAAFEQANPFKYFEGERIHTFNPLFNGKPQVKAEIELVTIFQNLLQHDGFRKRFIDTFSLMGGSVFDYTRCCGIIDSLYCRIEPSLQLEGSTASSMVASLRSQLENRMSSMMGTIGKYDPMQLSSTPARTLKVQTTTPGSSLLLNGLEIPYGMFNGKVFAPARLRAVAPAGYRFVGWKKGFDEPSQVFGKGVKWSYTTDEPDAEGQWTTLDYDSSSWPTMVGAFFGDATAIRQASVVYPRPKQTDEYHFIFQTNRSFTLYVNGISQLHYVAESSEVETHKLVFDYSLIRLGRNVFAVAFDDMSATDGSKEFSAKMVHYAQGSGEELYSADEEIEAAREEGLQLTACFEPIEREEGQTAGIPPVRINEVSAGNDVFVNDYFKRNDWIEIYNTTSEPVDLAGCYLSNDPQRPEMWAIEGPQTVIEPHGYLVIWCDKLEPISQLHAPFKIAAEGSTLTLTAQDGSWSDSFEYPLHDGNSSIGRYPDGANQLYSMTFPTIGKHNILNSYAQYLYDATGTGIAELGETPSSTLTLTYGERRLSLAGPSADEARIEVFSVGGQSQSVVTTVVRSDFVYADVDRLPAGVYVARATGKGLKTTTCKFVVGR